jgi:hypothetical protein
MTADTHFNPEQSTGPAKPRHRWLRRLMKGFALFVLFVIVSFAIWYGWCKLDRDAEIAKIRAAGDPVWFEELRPAPIDPAQDGMPILRQAFASMKPLPDELADDLYNLHAPVDEPLDDEETAEMLKKYGDVIMLPENITFREWRTRHVKDDEQEPSPRPPVAVRERVLVEKLRPLMANNQTTYRLVDEALNRPKLTIEIDYDHPKPVVADCPDVWQIMHVQKLLLAKARCELFDGLIDDAARTLIALLGINQRKYEAASFNIVDALVAASQADIALDVLAETLAAGSMSAERMSQFDKPLADLESRLRIQRMWIGERAAGLTTMENAFEDVVLNRPQFKNRIVLALIQPIVWNNQTYYLRAMSAPVTYADRYDEETGRLLNEAYDREIAPLELDELTMWGKLQRIGMAVMLPATASVNKRVIDARNRMNAARVGIQVDKYRQERGRLPKSLNEVVGGVLKALPEDVENGQPLAMVVEGDAFAICPSHLVDVERQRLVEKIRIAKGEPNAPTPGDGEQEKPVNDNEIGFPAFYVVYQTVKHTPAARAN